MGYLFSFVVNGTIHRGNVPTDWTDGRLHPTLSCSTRDNIERNLFVEYKSLLCDVSAREKSGFRGWASVSHSNQLERTVNFFWPIDHTSVAAFKREADRELESKSESFEAIIAFRHLLICQRNGASKSIQTARSCLAWFRSSQRLYSICWKKMTQWPLNRSNLSPNQWQL